MLGMAQREVRTPLWMGKTEAQFSSNAGKVGFKLHTEKKNASLVQCAPYLYSLQARKRSRQGIVVLRVRLSTARNTRGWAA